MKRLIAGAAVAAAAVALLAFDYLRPGVLMVNPDRWRAMDEAQAVAERIRRAEARSQGVRGLYMTSTVANDRGRAATKLREDIVALLDETELDALVIDVKETEGGLIITDDVTTLISELHAKGVWVIARQAVFKDSSQEAAHPEWYLKRADARLPDGQGRLWRDNRSGSWLDPASREVWTYQLESAKAAADAGFDEIQFDYIRFPSDGDVDAASYPAYDGKRPKSDVLREFFAFLHGGLKAHRPELMLSADLFGHVALERGDLGIGQRLEDIGEYFNYVSLMVYPSHYYSGFEAPADPGRNLPALSLPYRHRDPARVAASHPYEVVHRTLLIANDVLAGKISTTTDQVGEIVTATSSPISSVSPSSPARRAKLRPWLQDFDLAFDSGRGIRYDAKKIRAQIDAAEAAGASGWLLWSPDNVYTKEALQPKPAQSP